MALACCKAPIGDSAEGAAITISHNSFHAYQDFPFKQCVSFFAQYSIWSFSVRWPISFVLNEKVASIYQMAIFVKLEVLLLTKTLGVSFEIMKSSEYMCI